MKCQRDPSCVASDNHAGLCVRIDGTLIMQRPVEVRRTPTDDSGWRDENTSPRHTVPHPHRHPEAEAQIAAAHQPPDAFETAMQTGVDDALEERARSIRLCAHVAPDWDCASCRSSDWGRNPGDPPGTLRRFPRPTTPAGRFEAICAAVLSGDMPPDVARRAMNDPLEDMMRREHAKQAADPGPVFAIPGSGTADYASAPIAGTYSIGTGRQYKAVQVGAANLLDTSTLDPDDTVTRGDRTLMYADAADCEAAYLRLSYGNRPGYWANDGTLRWVDGMPPIAEWLKMHGFPREETRPKEPSVVLTGNDLDAFESFSRCAAALEEHAEQGQALQVAYRNALQAVSAMAARRNRGK